MVRVLYGVTMDRTRVKICGVTRLEDAELAVSLGAWAVGMIFYAGSPRRCSIDRAELIAAALRRRAEIAGVFVNATLVDVTRVAERLGLTLIQLHGDEGPAFCAEVARRTGARTIRGIGIATAGALQDLERFHTDFHLLDGHAPGLRGGTGERFDWGLLSGRRSQIPSIISGGLDAANVAAAIAAADGPYAVDVASGVESAPGIKDEQRLRSFFAAARPPVPAL